jgi:hypothetical protein
MPGLNAEPLREAEAFELAIVPIYPVDSSRYGLSLLTSRPDLQHG